MWLTGWQYRKKITISGSTGAGTNYQVLLKVGESSGATGANFHLGGHSANFPSGQNQSGDIRFTDNDEVTLLDFWVEKVEGTSPNRVAYIWVEVADSLDSNVDIYCYYGNSSATNYSNGDNTFLLFDDFDDNSVDTNKWDVGTNTFNKYVKENSGLFAITGTDLSADENSVSGYYRVYGTAATNIVREDGPICGWLGKGIRSVATFNLANGLVIEGNLNLYSYGQGGAYYRGITVGLSTIQDKDNRVDLMWLWDASNNNGIGTGLCFEKEEAGTRSQGLMTELTLSTGIYRVKYVKNTGNTFTIYFDNNSGSTTSTFNSSTARIGLFGSARGVGDTLDARYDWIFARKYASPEPAFSSAGSEETPSPSLNTSLLRRRLLIR